MKKALMLQGGTMRGAFLVGALKTFYKELGPDYFDLIIATSVGVFEQAFYASKQIETMENTWLKYVTNKQLINFWNPLKGREILDLDYLVDLFQSDKSMLDTSAMLNSKAKLLTFVTDYKTREPELIDLKTDVFKIMKATCALPIVYRKPVYINGKRYFDSFLAPKNKFQNILEKEIGGYDTVAISVYGDEDIRLKGINKILKPSKMPLWNALDTNTERITETIKQGELDALNFIKNKLC